MEENRHVFISHSSKDAEAARAVCEGLEDRGLRCWIAPRDIEGGTSYPKSLNRAIRNSGAVLLVLTPSSNDSEMVHKELGLAAKYHIPMLPVRAAGIEATGAVEFFINLAQLIEAPAPPTGAALDDVAKAARGLLGSRDAQRSSLERSTLRIRSELRTWGMVNALLVGLLVLLALVWHEQHLASMLPTWLAGSVVAAVGVVFLLIKAGMNKDGIAAIFKVLFGRRARLALLGAIVLFGVLNLTTSSIHLTRSGPFAESTVSVEGDGISPFAGSQVHRIFPLFFGRPAGWIELTFRVDDPLELRAGPLPFRPWSRIDLDLPGDFDEEPYCLLRLVPGITIVNELSKPEDRVESEYDLSVEITGTRTVSRTLNLRRGLVYLCGAPGPEGLKLLLARETPQALRSRYEHYLRSSSITEDLFSKYIDVWNREADRIGTGRLHVGDRVRVVVSRSGKPPFRKTVSIEADTPMFTHVYLERSGGD